MSQSFFGPTPGGGSGAAVTVTNFPSPELVNINQATPGTTNGVVIKNTSSSPSPAVLVDASGNPISTNTWSGALGTTLAAVDVQSVGSIVNRVAEAISAGTETDTLNRPSSCSNFLYCTIYNNSGTECTYTIGNTNGTTGSVQAGATINFPCNVTKLVLHATAANQQIVGWVFDPTVT